MADSRSLMSMLALGGRHLPTLVMPPGSAILLAGIIALAGWEIGLNMPYTVSDILAFRSMGAVAVGVATGDTGWQHGLSAIYATLKALPSPSRPAILSAIFTATALLIGAGGWINTALSLIQGRDADEATWWQGVRRSGISTLWFLIIFSLAFAAIGISAVAAGMVLRSVVTGVLPAGIPAMLASGGAIALLIASFAGACYGIAVTSLTGVVAIAEPQTPFLRLPLRARRLFKVADGWRFLRQFSLVITGWVIVKALAYQLMIPFAPVAQPFSKAVSAGGALLYTVLTIGDGLVLLLGILWAARTYVHGLQKEG